MNKPTHDVEEQIELNKVVQELQWEMQETLIRLRQGWITKEKIEQAYHEINKHNLLLKNTLEEK